MPSKDPNFWSYIVAFWRDIIKVVTDGFFWYGVAFSMALPFIRTAYKDNHTPLKEMIRESILCAALTIGISATLEVAFGWGDKVYMFVGIAVGYYGRERTEKILSKWINTKVNDPYSSGQDYNYHDRYNNNHGVDDDKL